MLRQLRPALLSVLAFTVLTGLVFPLVVYAIGQAAFRGQANGSLIRQNGRVIGSDLLGQNFARPDYFHPRPSAAGNGYDASASSGTNLGPTSAKLINGADGFAGVRQLAEVYREENGLAPGALVPPDAVTRSASGLDPHISPENAALQVERVAHARNLDKSRVRQFVAQDTEGRTLGLLGEARVNVLRLNLALDRAAPRKPNVP